MGVGKRLGVLAFALGTAMVLCRWPAALWPWLVAGTLWASRPEWGKRIFGWRPGRRRRRRRVGTREDELRIGRHDSWS